MSTEIVQEPTDTETSVRAVAISSLNLQLSNVASVANNALADIKSLIADIGAALSSPLDVTEINKILDPPDGGSGGTGSTDTLGVAAPSPDAQTLQQDIDARETDFQNIISNLIIPDLSGVDGAFTVDPYGGGSDIGFNAPQEPNLLPVTPPSLSSIPRPPTGSPPAAFNYDPERYVSGLIEHVMGMIREASELTMTEIPTESSVALDGNTEAIALVDNAIETAVYDRAVLRMLDEEAKQVEDVENDLQARGFTLPPGLLSAKIARIRTAALKAREDLNNDIIKSRIELEQKRTEYELQKAGQITDAQYKHDSIVAQFHSVNAEYFKAIAQNKAVYADAVAKLETINADIHKMNETLKFEAEKTSIESALTVWNTNVEIYKAQMQAYQIESETVLASVRAETEYNKGLVEIYAQQVAAERGVVEAEMANLEAEKAWYEKENTKINAEAERIKAENDRAMAQASLYNAVVSSHSERLKTIATVGMMDMERYKAEMAGKGEEIRALASKAVAILQAATQRYAVDMEVLKQQVQIQGSIASSALNSVNIGSSISAGSSSSSSYGVSRTRSASHSYDYKGSIASATKAEDTSVLP